MTAIEPFSIFRVITAVSRFDHNFEAVRDAVAAGKIGDTHIIKVTSRDPEPPSAEYVKVSGGIIS